MRILGELSEVILYVQDMAAQVAFYRDTLALEVREPKDAADWREVHWVELDTGGCTLVLHSGGQRRPDQDTFKIVFAVRDIQRARYELVGKGVDLSAVRSPAPGVQVCDGVDPEGNLFSIEQRGQSHTARFGEGRTADPRD